MGWLSTEGWRCNSQLLQSACQRTLGHNTVGGQSGPRKSLPQHHTTTTSLICWYKACFHVVNTKIKRPDSFSSLLISDFGKLIEIVAPVSCSWLTGVAQVSSAALRPSASRLDMFFYSDALLRWLWRVVIWDTVAFLPAQSKAMSSLLDILFFRPFSVKPGDVCAGKSEIFLSFILYPFICWTL